MDFERLIAALNDYVIVASVIAINCAALSHIIVSTKILSSKIVFNINNEKYFLNSKSTF